MDRHAAHPVRTLRLGGRGTCAHAPWHGQAAGGFACWKRRRERVFVVSLQRSAGGSPG